MKSTMETILLVVLLLVAETAIDAAAAVAAASTPSSNVVGSVSSLADNNNNAATAEEGKINTADDGEGAGRADRNGEKNDQQQQQQEEQEQHQCSVYMAPSTIPGAGLGMFSGKRVPPKGLLLHGDLTVPVTDMYWHMGKKAPDEGLLLDSYYWTAHTFEYMGDEAIKTQGFSFGIGAAVNCDLLSINADYTESDYDTAGLYRHRYHRDPHDNDNNDVVGGGGDPGSGAFTPYHDRRAFAKVTVNPGDELFVNYGKNYFMRRTETYGYMPMPADYDKASYLLLQFKRLMIKLDKLSASKGKETNRKRQQVRNAIVAEDLMNFTVAMRSVWDTSRPLQAIPSSVEEVFRAVKVGGIKRIQPSRRRSLNKLRKHGRCVDQIRPGLSTIWQAGRGAFAARNLPAGSIVAVNPLIHFPDKDLLIMYGDQRDDGWFPAVHRQLVLNYCMGHEHSKVLLCGYGAHSGLINHFMDSGSTNEQREPNVRLEWDMKLTRNPEWLEQPPELWTNETHNGLVLDVIATRDIAEGEEILVDYGAAWQRAWDDHVKAWQQKTGATSNPQYYRAAFELNDADTMRGTDVVQFVKRDNPVYRQGNVALWCHRLYQYLAQGLGAVDWWYDDQEEDVDHKPCRALDSYQVVQTRDDGSITASRRKYLVEIYTIRDTDDGGDEKLKYDDPAWEDLRKRYPHSTVIVRTNVLFGVPDDAFYFRDDRYTRDHAQPWSFRHEMQIPDDIMPPAWRNDIIIDDNDDNDNKDKVQQQQQGEQEQKIEQKSNKKFALNLEGARNFLVSHFT